MRFMDYGDEFGELKWGKGESTEMLRLRQGEGFWERGI
jgi:hypothetical protein